MRSCSIMELNKFQLKRNFDKYAEGYDEVSGLQSHVSEVLANYMHTALHKESRTVKSSFNMLDIGCGTGLAIQSIIHMMAVSSLLEEDSVVDVLGLDISPSMLDACREKFSEFNWSFEEADFDSYMIDSSNRDKYEIVLSCFAAHWFTDLQGFFVKSKELLTDTGLLVMAIPLDGSLKEIKAVNDKLTDGVSVPMLSFPTHAEVMGLLIDNGFKSLLHTRQEFSPLFETPLHALRSMKLVGASYPGTSSLSSSGNGSGSVLRTLHSFVELYNELFTTMDATSSKSSVTLSYNILFIIAEKDIIK